MNATTLIFDAGNVLIDYRWLDMLMDHGLSRDEAMQAGDMVFRNPLWGELDEGLRSQDEIIADYARQLPDYADLIRWFITHGELMHLPRPAVWERVRLLKQTGYDIYLLSNYSENLFRLHTQGASFMEDIDGMVVSYQTHTCKPDPAIYLHLLRTYQLIPQECIFFDDREENTTAAKALGIPSFTITSQEYLLGLLDLLLLASPPHYL